MPYTFTQFTGIYQDVINTAIDALHAMAVVEDWAINQWVDTAGAKRLDISKNNLFLNIEQQSTNLVRWSGSTTPYLPGETYLNQTNAGEYSGFGVYTIQRTYFICTVAFGDFIGVFIKENVDTSDNGTFIGISELEKIGTYNGGMWYSGFNQNSYTACGGFCTNTTTGYRGGVYAPDDAPAASGWFTRDGSDVTNGPKYSGGWHAFSMPAHKASMSLIQLPIYVGKMNGNVIASSTVVPLGRIPYIYLINPGSVLFAGDTFNNGNEKYVVCSSSENMIMNYNSAAYPTNSLAVRYE